MPSEDRETLSVDPAGNRYLFRVATVREKYLENEVFLPGQGKVWEFCGWQGYLERTWKVREFENKWLLQEVFRKFIYFAQEGKRYTFS